MRPDTEKTYAERMLRVLVHIQKHLDEEMSLESLASVASFSPYHFHRIFRGMVGESVKEHVRRLRLERAAQRLKQTDQPVTSIAFDAGYEAHESFTRAFRSAFGTSPSAFREEHRDPSLVESPTGVHFVGAEGDVHFSPLRKGDKEIELRIEPIEPMRVAFMRHVGPYTEVGPIWQKLSMWAGMKGLFGPNTKMLGLCHDDPDVTPPDKIRYDACIVVDASVEAEGDVGVQEIGGGEYAIAIHEGPYEKLGETYSRLCGEWLAQSDRELRHEPSFEVYVNSPMNAAPEDLRTEICLPLK